MQHLSLFSFWDKPSEDLCSTHSSYNWKEDDISDKAWCRGRLTFEKKKKQCRSDWRNSLGQKQCRTSLSRKRRKGARNCMWEWLQFQDITFASYCNCTCIVLRKSEILQFIGKVSFHRHSIILGHLHGVAIALAMWKFDWCICPQWHPKGNWTMTRTWKICCGWCRFPYIISLHNHVYPFARLGFHSVISQFSLCISKWFRL